MRKGRIVDLKRAATAAAAALAVLGAGAGTPAVGSAQARGGQAVSTEHTSGGSAHPVLAQMDVALSGFVSGDPSAWKGILSRRDDATLFGGWGGFEHGWAQLDPRYDWAAARFQPGSSPVQQELISSGGDGTFFYTVAIERSNARLTGQSEPLAIALRVTHIYRHEEGEWKLVHRHADPLVAIQTTESVVQRP